jgi:hypothetical protein
MMTRLALSTAMIAMLAPSPAAAQFDWVGGLISRMTDISIARTLGDENPTWDGSTVEAEPASKGLGIELLFELSDTDPAGVRPGQRFLFEMGIGYFENPFHIEAPDFSMRGALRDLPMVTVYANWTQDLLALPRRALSDCENTADGCSRAIRMNAYGAVRGGLVQLNGTRAYVDTADGQVLAIAAEGDAFRSGLVAGAVLSMGPVHAFAEAEWTRRRIHSVQWDGEIPATLPRNLDFRDVLYVIGLQLRVGKGGD